MSKTLFLHNIKNVIKLWIIFVLILFMYKSIIIGMFDPDSAEAMEALLTMMPEGLASAMGFTLPNATLAGYLSGYYYGFIIIMFPMIYTIILSYKLVAKYVDNGSMAYILANPITRRQVIVTQMITMIGSLFDLFVTVTLIGLAMSAIMFPSALSIGHYLLLNLGVFMLFFAISSITFFFSTLFNEGRHALSLSIAVPVGFFVISMLAGVDVRLDFLQYFTIFSLFDNHGIIVNPGWQTALHFIVLASIGILFYGASIRVFCTKDLTL